MAKAWEIGPADLVFTCARIACWKVLNGLEKLDDPASMIGQIRQGIDDEAPEAGQIIADLTFARCMGLTYHG